MYADNLARTGFNPDETTITPATAPSLGPHWVSVSSNQLIFDQPIQADGMVFWGDLGGFEHASDPATGNVIWSADVGKLQLPSSCTGKVPNPLGVTATAQFQQLTLNGVSTPVLFVGGGDSSVYALNASTGTVIWRTHLGADQWDYVWDSPAMWNGALYIGIASPAVCPRPTQGRVFKLDAGTGAREASFDVVPTGCIGGGVWGSIAIDTAAKTLYVATGSPAIANCPNTPKPYTPAILELSAKDLTLLGYWQLPRADWVQDSDFGSTPMLFTNSSGTPMVALANKNGWLYAFDRGQLPAGPVWQFQIASSTQPQLAPSAFDGSDIYAAGGTTTINGVSCKGGLYKIDPTTGVPVWAVCTPGWNLGAVSMAPGVIVIGTGKSVGVYAASDGALLYSYTDSGPNSRFEGSASIANGQILVGNQDGKMVALGL